ncbi:unnamed protein product [Spirodela intermedia]|uniref:Uncharacterized protein n=1 Tax=Spirodela intermedia TaxID=51605 RepID=A0A7I8IBH0_SPIIN|nr:unnamed protein product [Spirodela intermedia]CAA6654221.1 unnamed protein product [Spirodela intermedia]
MAAVSKGGVRVPALLLVALTATALLLFFLLPALSPGRSATSTTGIACPAASPVGTTVTSSAAGRSPDPVTVTKEDVSWLRSQLDLNRLGEPPSTADQWHALRKGINPRTRAQQLEDFRRYKGISHYEGADADNHTTLSCPGELLVEEHHSNYGEPWAGGRDVFEFLAGASGLQPSDLVLEIGCGTLRVGLHFIRYLDTSRFHCLERDELSLMAAFRYELPSQGLLHKRPLIVRYDLIYASAVFLHMPDQLVWVGLERLAGRLKPGKGRIFVSHNIKFCSRLGSQECERRLGNLGMEYVGKRMHDSLLFNHYEIWFEFRRPKA